MPNEWYRDRSRVGVALGQTFQSEYMAIPGLKKLRISAARLKGFDRENGGFSLILCYYLFCLPLCLLLPTVHSSDAQGTMHPYRSTSNYPSGAPPPPLPTATANHHPSTPDRASDFTSSSPVAYTPKTNGEMFGLLDKLDNKSRRQ
ncbi:hypothetical protein TI39_contig460g00001 [Zymoseptoria brevis]|uniref:Uncharacterized protein n=1 Tax=Zymoseptoria brevis TaxID=1047168 RepID=A0A0F4GK50_9PEZI|nr:hypothetical protein TI39_contig460g00001 [Zymoseptoria brevis]